MTRVYDTLRAQDNVNLVKKRLDYFGLKFDEHIFAV